MTRSANHAPCRAGVHSPASRSLFSVRFTRGSAIVRLSRSAAMSRRRMSAMPGAVSICSAIQNQWTERRRPVDGEPVPTHPPATLER